MVLLQLPTLIRIAYNEPYFALTNLPTMTWWTASALLNVHGQEICPKKAELLPITTITPKKKKKCIKALKILTQCHLPTPYPQTHRVWFNRKYIALASGIGMKLSEHVRGREVTSNQQKSLNRTSIVKTSRPCSWSGSLLVTATWSWLILFPQGNTQKHNFAEIPNNK